MKNKFLFIIFIGLVFGLSVSFGQIENQGPKPEISTPTDDLSPEAKSVVDYLLIEWKKQFRSTSIPMAMSNLGMEQNDDLRMEIGQYFRDNTQLAKNLRWWGANNYILNHDERLIAKYLINNYDEEKNILPARKELQEAIGISGQELKNRLAFMARAELLQESDKTELGYSLAEGYNRWGGPLRHNFHTVSIEGDKPFDVW